MLEVRRTKTGKTGWKKIMLVIRNLSTGRKRNLVERSGTSLFRLTKKEFKTELLDLDLENGTITYVHRIDLLYREIPVSELSKGKQCLIKQYKGIQDRI